jgi:hypothetical protein
MLYPRPLHERPTPTVIAWRRALASLTIVTVQHARFNDAVGAPPAEEVMADVRLGKYRRGV